MDVVGIFENALRSAFSPQAAVYALLAIGLNIHYGYTGLLNFGQVGFMLVGAYGLGITVAIVGWSMWVGILMGILAAVALAAALGLPTLRLRTDYFAITTIAAAEVLRFIFRSGPATDLTGGPFGLQSIANAFYDINPIPAGRHGIGAVQYSHQQLWVGLVTWGLVALATLAVFLLMRAPWGRVIKSIREDEDAATSLGKNVFAYKMQSLVLGGVIGALGGIMFAIAGSTVNPQAFLPIVTFFAYTILILGGSASTLGPIIGTIIFWFLFSGFDAFMRQAQGADVLPSLLEGGNAVGATTFTLVGLALMLLMIFRPQGIFGNKREMELDV
ncbi:MAG: branched-chain amino acid ABC transporter permease [Nitriliruptorales bacterium]|nr:branched-chain amino acid ABC transporter permease [Nitriliruptorales bacterium]